jgi:hypothetical protein
LLHRVQTAGERLDQHRAGVGQSIGHAVELRLMGHETLAPTAARIATVPSLDASGDHAAGDIPTMAGVACPTRRAEIVDATNGAVKGWRETDPIALLHGCHILGSREK